MLIAVLVGGGSDAAPTQAPPTEGPPAVETDVPPTEAPPEAPTQEPPPEQPAEPPPEQPPAEPPDDGESGGPSLPCLPAALGLIVVPLLIKKRERE